MLKQVSKRLRNELYQHDNHGIQLVYITHMEFHHPRYIEIAL